MDNQYDGRFYGLLTVKLQNPPADPVAVYAEIKKALGIDSPLIDDRLGVLPPHVTPHIAQMKPAGEEYFTVGVESKTLWDLVNSNHPGVLGCLHAMGYAGEKPPLFLKNPPPEPPQTRGGPRRNPKSGGPRV